MAEVDHGFFAYYRPPSISTKKCAVSITVTRIRSVIQSILVNEKLSLVEEFDESDFSFVIECKEKMFASCKRAMQFNFQAIIHHMRLRGRIEAKGVPKKTAARIVSAIDKSLKVPLFFQKSQEQRVSNLLSREEFRVIWEGLLHNDSFSRNKVEQLNRPYYHRSLLREAGINSNSNDPLTQQQIQDLQAVWEERLNYSGADLTTEAQKASDVNVFDSEEEKKKKLAKKKKKEEKKQKVVDKKQTKVVDEKNHDFDDEDLDGRAHGAMPLNDSYNMIDVKEELGDFHGNGVGVSAGSSFVISSSTFVRMQSLLYNATQFLPSSQPFEEPIRLLEPRAEKQRILSHGKAVARKIPQGGVSYSVALPSATERQLSKRFSLESREIQRLFERGVERGSSFPLVETPKEIVDRAAPFKPTLPPIRRLADRIPIDNHSSVTEKRRMRVAPCTPYFLSKDKRTISHDLSMEYRASAGQFFSLRASESSTVLLQMHATLELLIITPDAFPHLCEIIGKLICQQKSNEERFRLKSEKTESQKRARRQVSFNIYFTFTFHFVPGFK